MYWENASNSNSHTSLSVIGTPDEPDIARQIFPDAQPDNLVFAAGTADETVPIGMRGHESTIQATANGANVESTFSLNGVPLKVASQAQLGRAKGLSSC
jgi:hypothetical protein